MLLLVCVAAVIVSGATRLEVDGPASFDLRFWLFGLALAALLSQYGKRENYPSLSRCA